MFDQGQATDLSIEQASLQAFRNAILVKTISWEIRLVDHDGEAAGRASCVAGADIYLPVAPGLWLI